ncbi:MAG: DegV family protein [Clostridiales bacterium]|nr:DegV family protein [Clostridiales bacterium]
MNIKLIADSTCDLPQELVDKYNVRIVPLSISKGGQALKDGVEIGPADIFEFMDAGLGICSTSAVNVAEYTRVYEEERGKCDAIIHFVISSEMSSGYQNARVAAEDFDNIHIIDSRNLSMAIGHLVVDAAELAAEGKTPDEIVGKINEIIPLLDAGFVIDTLTYLHKGGRCTSIQALVSNVLNVKPSIVVANGKMTVGKKYRGKLEVVLRKYIDDKLSLHENIDTRRIFIADTMTAENRPLMEAAKAQIAKTLPSAEIYETKAGGTISCHCGPNTFGIFLIRRK